MFLSAFGQWRFWHIMPPMERSLSFHLIYFWEFEINSLSDNYYWDTDSLGNYDSLLTWAHTFSSHFEFFFIRNFMSICYSSHSAWKSLYRIPQCVWTRHWNTSSLKRQDWIFLVSQIMRNLKTFLNDTKTQFFRHKLCTFTWIFQTLFSFKWKSWYLRN